MGVQVRWTGGGGGLNGEVEDGGCRTGVARCMGDTGRCEMDGELQVVVSGHNIMDVILLYVQNRDWRKRMTRLSVHVDADVDADVAVVRLCFCTMPTTFAALPGLYQALFLYFEPSESLILSLFVLVSPQADLHPSFPSLDGPTCVSGMDAHGLVSP